MTSSSHLWAIGYDEVSRADAVRDQITKLAWGSGEGAKDLILLDAAVVVRHPDGTFTFDRQRFPGVANILGCTIVGFLAGLVVAAPLAGAAIGALLGGAGTTAAAVSGAMRRSRTRKPLSWKEDICPGVSSIMARLLCRAGVEPRNS